MNCFKPILSLKGANPMQYALRTSMKHEEILHCYELIYGKRFFKKQVLAYSRHGKTTFFKSNKGKISKSGTGFNSQKLRIPRLLKPFMFTLSFSVGSFMGCALWQYENECRQVMNYVKLPNLRFLHSDNFFPKKEKNFTWRDELNNAWKKLNEQEKLIFFICLANLVIFLAWKRPKFQSTMITYFSINAKSNAICWPLVLSTFSHYSAIHLAMNMYALNSFSKIGIASLGKEQFLGLYLAGGVISSFTSLFFKVIFNKSTPSVGASGAILAIVGYLSAEFPDMSLSIIFLPWYTFTAASAVKVLLAFDLAGLVLGWKFFDHAAHLGGVLSGIAWCYWGNAYIWQKREALLQWWHEFRNSVK